jgi:hypothetical protein
MNKTELKKILRQVKDGSLTIDEAHEKILADMNEKVDKIKNDK